MEPVTVWLVAIGAFGLGVVAGGVLMGARCQEGSDLVEWVGDIDTDVALVEGGVGRLRERLDAYELAAMERTEGMDARIAGCLVAAANAGTAAANGQTAVMDVVGRMVDVMLGQIAAAEVRVCHAGDLANQGLREQLTDEMAGLLALEATAREGVRKRAGEHLDKLAARVTTLEAEASGEGRKGGGAGQRKAAAG